MRTRLDLDGVWDFLHASNDSSLEPVVRRKIVVPGPWQSQFADLRMKAGTGAYRRVVEITRDMREGRLFLVFGASFHFTKVWINGAPVGANEGGFLPFSFEISEYVVEGENEILIRVHSPIDNPHAYPDSPLAEIPFGKQSWYGPLAGIWQSVYIECRSIDFIERARIVPDLDTQRVLVTVFTNDPLTRDAYISIAIYGSDDQLTASRKIACVSGAEEISASFELPGVLAWSPDEPHLYHARIAIERDGRVVDAIDQTFGFRKFEARSGKFYLNGKLLYLRGALDQDYYPDTISTPPSEAFLEDQFRKAKSLGLNCVRCHIKAPDPIYYDVADRVGLLVWAELPNGGLSTERSRARKQRLLKGMVDRDSHHPSIVIWTIINENWGVDLVHDASHRAWLKQTFAWLKQYDPTRLVVDNSPLAPSFHLQSDIADYHFYAAIPDSRNDWDKFVDDLASRPSWLFSPEGDAVTSGDEPLVCSEFGNWGLPDPAALADAQGREPWWFETGHDWGEGVMYPHGVENRFGDWSLNRVFGSLRAFVEECQWQQFRALKYEIEAMRRKAALAGYVVTELTDVHWESNGLLDMRRNARVFHDDFETINTDIVIAPKWGRRSYWDHEYVQLELDIATGGCDVAACELIVSGEFGARAPVAAQAPGAVESMAPITLRLRSAEAVRMERISLSLQVGDEVIARNYVDLTIFPTGKRDTARSVRVWSASEVVRSHLHELGHAVVDRLEDCQLALAHAPTVELTKFVRDGGRLLIAAESEFALQPLFPHWQAVRVLARDGTVWRGDWASSFAWLRRSGPFADLPGPKLLDASFDRVIPSHVISGCNLLDFQARVHAGLVVGWVHKAVALTVERTYGAGHFAATTFRLFRDPPGADPMASYLLARHIDLALKSWEQQPALMR